MRITGLRRSPTATLMVPLLALSIAACEQPTEPTEVIRPALRELRRETNHLGSGIVRVVAVPEDPTLRPEPFQRIEVQLKESVRDGGEETLLLAPAYCGGDHDVPRHRCDEFVVALTSTANFDVLEARASDLPGRLLRSGLVDELTGEVHESTGYATVVILDGQLADAMSEARFWPGVRFDRHPAGSTGRHLHRGNGGGRESVLC